MTNARPRWLMPFVFAGAAIGRAPDVVEPLFSPALAALLVGAVALVVGAAVVVVAVATSPGRPVVDDSKSNPSQARRLDNSK